MISLKKNDNNHASSFIPGKGESQQNASYINRKVCYKIGDETGESIVGHFPYLYLLTGGERSGTYGQNELVEIGHDNAMGKYMLHALLNQREMRLFAFSYLRLNGFQQLSRCELMVTFYNR